MCFLLRLFRSAEPKFTTSLDWIEIPADSFCLTGYIGKMKIAKATGDYQAGRGFRLVKIDVYPEFRSNGYGSRMIEKLISEANQKGCSNFVFVGVSVNNTGAAKLYRSRFKALPQAISNCADKKDYVRQLP